MCFNLLIETKDDKTQGMPLTGGLPQGLLKNISSTVGYISASVQAEVTRNNSPTATPDVSSKIVAHTEDVEA